MDPTGPTHPAWRHIAVAVDASPESAHAFRVAVAAARRENARLTLVCVMPPPWPTVALAGVSPAVLRSQLVAAADSIVRRFAAALPEGLPCTMYARCGRAASQILEILDRERADVLFMASRGDFLEPTRRWTIRRLRRVAAAYVIAVELEARDPGARDAWRSHGQAVTHALSDPAVG